MLITIKNISGGTRTAPPPFSISLANAASKTLGVSLADLLDAKFELLQEIAAKKFELTFDEDDDAKTLFDMAIKAMVQGAAEIRCGHYLKDAAAGDAATIPLYVAGKGSPKVKSVSIMALAASTAHGSNFATLEIKRFNTSGAAAAVVATRNTSTGTGSTIAAGHAAVTVALAETLALGESLVLVTTKAGTGVVLDLYAEVKLEASESLVMSSAI